MNYWGAVMRITTPVKGRTSTSRITSISLSHAAHAILETDLFSNYNTRFWYYNIYL